MTSVEVIIYQLSVISLQVVREIYKKNLFSRKSLHTFLFHDVTYNDGFALITSLIAITYNKIIQKIS